jgi:hypothetical protein
MDTPEVQPLPPVTEAAHQPVRKRKIKRSSRIKKRLPLIITLVLVWVILLAVWYYLVAVGVHPPAEPGP